MKRFQRLKALCLLLSLLLVWGGGALLYFDSGKTQPHPLSQTMLDAYDRMSACMSAIREEKLRRGLSIDPETDPFDTGLLGVSSSAITTTVGALEAKRTSANPHMAALCVRLLYEAGVSDGDRVGCCFSGSFPALNLAVLCAVDAIGAEAVYIASIGASTYGANQPELTGPEMLLLCYRQGLLSAPPAGVTMGGEDDRGRNMLAYEFDDYAPLLQQTLQRLEQEGITVTSLPDYAENLRWRMSLYGEPDCFVNVGGNVTGQGKDGVGYELGQGLLSPDALKGPLTDDSGLLARYLAGGVPCIHLLNVKKLCADYGLAYDPAVWPSRGESRVFFVTRYQHAGLALTLFLGVLPLLAYYGVRQWEKKSTSK